LERSPHLRPAVPPPDLDLDLLFASVETMRKKDPRFVLFSHFGPSPDGASDLDGYRAIVTDWKDVALAAARENPDSEYVARRLEEHDAITLRTEGVSPSEAERESLVSGYDLAAKGFLRYFDTHGEIPSRAP
ncbi:MAG: hypothetical protein L3K02_03260, partial [Thermoplasmata archaeon]|nr:hypothetical protein [Thermoplasmata archaeon]